MKFFNRQFGELEYDNSHVLMFPEGIIGFEQARSFLVVHDEDSEPFRWLVSLEDSDLSFPLLEPSVVVPDYREYFASDDETSVYLVASLSERIEQSTVNLRSPILIDNARGVGRQTVLSNDTLPIHYVLMAPKAVAQEQ